MNRILSYFVTSADAGDSIEHFLSKRGYSSKLLSHLRSYPTGIFLNGFQAYTTRILAEDDELVITILEFPSSEKLIATELSLSVIYEDEDIAVIDKPAGMPVHPSLGNYTNTLANACAWHYRNEASPFIFRAVNRLDRDTTGLVLIAKNPLSAAVLYPQTASKSIRRTYLAATIGELPEFGTINAPIARVDGSTIERCVDFDRGDRAVTHYERLCAENGLSLAKLHLETGRTHQIRVHMKYLGYPLPGDFLYYPDTTHISRQALHSWTLEMIHPVTGQSLSFIAPLPDDIKKLFPHYPEPDLHI